MMRGVLALLFACCALPSPLFADQKAGQAASAAERMQQAGPQELGLRSRTGTWEVVTTMWPKPGAAPVVTRGLVAERAMVGPILQEIMRPSPGSSAADFRRIDYMHFDRVEGRWKYVSMDTRFPVSIMPASSFADADGDTINFRFDSQAFVGFGSQVEGRFMVCTMSISRPDADHETKKQYFNMASGDGQPWLFVQYEYVRKR